MHSTNIPSPTMLWASHHCRYGEVRTGSSVPMITTAVWFSISRGASVGAAIFWKILKRLGLHTRSEGKRKNQSAMFDSAGQHVSRNSADMFFPFTCCQLLGTNMHKHKVFRSIKVWTFYFVHGCFNTFYTGINWIVYYTATSTLKSVLNSTTTSIMNKSS